MVSLCLAIGCAKNSPEHPKQSRFFEQARSFGKRSAHCESGFQAFKSTVHVLLRKDCLPCHDLGGKGPPHAVEDPAASYPFILSYVNWGNMPQSKLITTGGNHHCITEGGHCISSEADMARVLKDWWDKGQKECPTAGNILTGPLPLSKINDKWSKIQWDLGKIDPKYDLVFLTAQVKNEAGLYSIRKFRIEGNDKPLKLKTFYLVLNGNGLESSFAFVNAIAMPKSEQASTVLTSYTVNFRSENSNSDKLSIGLDDMAFSLPVVCHEVEKFKSSVKPTLEIRRCATCHGNPEDPSYKNLALSKSDEENCKSLLERGNGQYLVDTPLIAYPLRGVNEHYQVIPNSGEVFPAWTEWLEKERAHAD